MYQNELVHRNTYKPHEASESSKQSRRNILDCFHTCELVEELAKREGVDSRMVGMEEKFDVGTLEGPCIHIVVID